MSPKNLEPKESNWGTCSDCINAEGGVCWDCPDETGETGHATEICNEFTCVNWSKGTAEQRLVRMIQELICFIPEGFPMPLGYRTLVVKANSLIKELIR